MAAPRASGGLRQTPAQVLSGEHEDSGQEHEDTQGTHGQAHCEQHQHDGGADEPDDGGPAWGDTVADLTGEHQTDDCTGVEHHEEAKRDAKVVVSGDHGMKCPTGHWCSNDTLKNICPVWLFMNTEPKPMRISCLNTKATCNVDPLLQDCPSVAITLVLESVPYTCRRWGRIPQCGSGRLR